MRAVASSADPPPVRFEQTTEVRAAYSEGAGIYRILPAAVALPNNQAELCALVEWALATRTPLIPRGAGSGMGGGNVGDGVVVDLTPGFSRPLEVMSGHATVGAGVAYRMLAEAAAATEQRLPPEPSSSRFCTLGGMVACNAAGARSLAYGSIRAWVDAVEVVWADGTAGWVRRGEHGRWPIEDALATLVKRHAPLIRSRFPATTKNSSGYALDRYLETGDLVDVLVGSEGTLGVVTQCRLRLAPLPAHRASVLVALRRLDDLAPAVSRIASLGPSALELLERTFLDLATDGAAGVPSESPAVLLAEFERASPTSTRAAVDRVAREMAALGAGVSIAVTPADESALWAIRHAASPVLARLPETCRSLQVVEDGCVPIAALGDYVAGVREAARRRGVEVVLFGHAGDGHLHVNALADVTRPGWREALRGLFEEVTALVASLGGTVAGEHGDGRLRAAALSRTYGPAAAGLFAEVKRLFDPNGILNPGVIVPDGSDPFARLKIGADAVTIPDAVAQALRAVERDARWQTPKVDLARDATS